MNIFSLVSDNPAWIRLQQHVWISRLKSFLWRACGVGAVALLGWIAANVGLLHVPDIHLGAVDINTSQWLTTGLGLLIGELTKYFNVNKPWIETQIP